MGLRPVVPGLRVLHDTHSSEKVEMSVPPGAELVVSPYMAKQLVDQRGSFKVDPQELAEGLAAEKAADEAAAAEASAEQEQEPAAEPVKVPKARKKVAS